MSVDSNEKPFIAELHDIGKLVDREALKHLGIEIRDHTFHNFNFSPLGISGPTSPSWWGQFSDEVKSLTSTKVPKNYISDVLLTNIADELSASISRTWPGSQNFQNRKKEGRFVTEGIYVLWNPDYYRKRVDEGKKWAAFNTLEDLKEMFYFINECNSPEKFFEKYEENLRLTAEDKSVPINIVDLYTHLELTGKIYRVLKKHSQTIEDNGTLYLKYLEDKIQTLNKATGGRINEPTKKGEWIYRLIFCYINFPQSLSRLQDLNVFRKRADLIKSFSDDENKKDYVLFFTDDFMCLFIPREDELKIKELLRSFLDAGFIIDYKEMEAELNLLTSSMERTYEKFHSRESSRYLKLYEKNLIPNFPETINPPLCDSCQMRYGKERIKDQVQEYLCDTCYEIRQMGDPACEYAEWEEKGLRAGWMKITLDQEQLSRTLHSLYEEYVDTHPVMQDVSSSDKDELKKSFRPIAVQMDFVKDYKLLIKAFNNQIYEIKDKDGYSLFTKENFFFPIENYYEFGIFKVYSGEEILAVLDLFCNLLEEYFPKSLKDSPIKLSISLAPVKYPYQAHWRFLSMPKNSINIQISGSSKLEIDISQYKLLREKIRREDSKLSHFLHSLADIEIETKSNMSVMLEIFNNRKKFPALLELIQSGLSVHQILSFYKLTSEVTIL